MTLVTLSLAVVCVQGILIPQEWLDSIRQGCTAFERNPHPPTLITAMPSLCELVSSPGAFLMPSSILWSPVEQYPADYFCPKCNVTDKVALKPVRWQDGNSPQVAPRKIHGINGPILLVGRVYRCCKGHDILSYHPDIISQVPVQEAIPFVLWHRTGFTCDLLDLVHSLVLAGVYVHVFLCRCVFACVCTSVCMSMCIGVCKCAQVCEQCTCICAYPCTCVCVRVCVCAYVRACVCMYLYVFACEHASVHVCAVVCMSVLV